MLLITSFAFALVSAPADTVYTPSMQGDADTCVGTANTYLALWQASANRLKHCAESSGPYCEAEYAEFNAIYRVLPAKDGTLAQECPYLAWWVRTNHGNNPDK